MHRLTKPGGFILINVAAMEMLRGDHSVLSHEVRRYSRRSLRALVVGAGFDVVRLTYTNQSLFLPLLCNTIDSVASRQIRGRRSWRVWPMRS
jgi:hypothetical protein